MTGRVHVTTLTALVRNENGRIVLCATQPGVARGLPSTGAVVSGGQVLGELDVLGTLAQLVVPAGVYGAVIEVASEGAARAAVAYGSTLVMLDPDVGGARADTAALVDASAGATGLVFRAPLGGRYYARPGPGADAFVRVGDEVKTGATIALVEVMKTFHRLRYGGDGMPETAKVTRIVPADGDDISRDAVLLELERIG